MEKEKRITIRLSQAEYDKIKKEADKTGTTASGYLRGILFKDEGNSIPQKLYYCSQPEKLQCTESIRKELVMLEYYTESLRGIKRDDREYMKERIENIWLMLK